jgi:hypothetical protein
MKLVTHELSINYHWEMHIEDDSIVNCKTQDNAYQLELNRSLHRVRVEPVVSSLSVVVEHSVLRVEEVSN